MKPIISVKNLSKKFQIREKLPYYSLRDSLSHLLTGFTKTGRTKEYNPFWALKDVSFDVFPGEVMGIIGRNGAGKSTLLKILSQITLPTKGTAVLEGRVASLLEVGTGFHPELTGRENIFLNGAILGMSRKEIKKKFDEIVNFAEIEKFLDSPVKHYSSGMYMRLAFAVAAHLESEILLVDEVLAVGDAEFQRKSLGKMESMTKQGRTILFVSHNLTAIENLCSKAIYVDHGKIIKEGEANKIIGLYLKSTSKVSKIQIENRTDRTGNGKIKVTNFYIKNLLNNQQNVLRSGDNYQFVIEYEKNSDQMMKNIVCSIDLYDEDKTVVLMARTNFTNQNLNIEKRIGKIFCTINDLNLAEGRYSISIFISQGEFETIEWIDNVTFITVKGGDFFGTGSVGLPNHCKTLTRANWETE